MLGTHIATTPNLLHSKGILYCLTLLLSLSTHQEGQRAGRTAVGGGDKAKIKDKFNFSTFFNEVV